MTLEPIDEMAARLRRQLVADLEAAGYVRSPGWREAIEEVPRHEFIPEFFGRAEPDGRPTIWEPVDAQRLGVERWLVQAYTDDSHVTQLDGQLGPADVSSAVTGMPTSSSTMPGLVVRMWEDLDVQDGHRVLEIGTGTGYSTALGCYRLGEQFVTSIEVDPGVAAKARDALDRVGYHPALVVGDGLAGVPEHAPYDRIIATCSLRSVPPAWIAQARPGAVILVTLSGWLGGTALAKLTVTGPDTAEGSFLPGYVGFMPARAQAPKPVMLPDMTGRATTRATAVGPDVVANYGTAHLVAQLALPHAQYLQIDAPLEHIAVQDDGSYAALSGGPDVWTVRQGGPRRLWDKAEAALAAWRAAGEPEPVDFRISVSATRQTVTVGGELLGELPS